MKNVTALLGLVLLSCGPAVNGTYRGPPLVTLTGQLTLAPSLTLEHGVRLAVAWYPNLAADTPVAPRAIATEELEYTGSFPQRFSFPLHAAPAQAAREVVTAEDGTRGEAAVGQLLAYEDVDGDGQLTVDAAGRSVDRILGSTAGAGPFDFFSSEQRDVVAWVKNADDLGLGHAGMKPGYNLLRFSSPLTEPAVLPLDTSIPLALTGDPRLQLIVCPEAYATPDPGQACGVPVWLTPPLNGALTLREDGDFDVFVMVQGGARRVTVNGVDVPTTDPDRVTFAMTYAAAEGVVHVGVNTVVVDARGFEPLQLAATVPARFEVTSPQPGQRLAPGGTLRAEWTEALGATLYSVNLGVGAASDGTLTAARTVELRVPAEQGPGELSVTAFDKLGLGRTTMSGLSVRSVPIQVGP